MADGDDEVGAHDHLDLTGGNDLALIRDLIMIAVVYGTRDHEELIIVALELRALMGHNGVFHDKFVDAKLGGHLGHLRLIGFMQAHPNKSAAVFLNGFQRGAGGVFSRKCLAIHKDAAMFDSALRWYRQGSGLTRRLGFLAAPKG